eukprot:PhF_6_TR9747/c0_g1_i1/m.15017/K05757/ARPC1A_B; actin related protein 2/3 complex, subunit 1A/1B
MSDKTVVLSRISNMGVTAFAFNKDRSKICYALANNEIIIASIVGNDASGWKEEYRSSMHELTVSCIDWCPATNCIASCGHDRVAYVWAPTGKSSWEPEMVTLAIESNMGALCCSWSASGKRFCVGTSTSSPSVVVKDESEGNNWWISSAIKNHAAGAIISSAFCPTEEALLATGSADGHLRVVSSFVKGVDPAEVRDKLGKLGNVLFDQQITGSWVNGVAWNAAGSLLAAVTHDSCVHIITRAAAADGAIAFSSTKKLRTLVPRCLTFVGDYQFVVAGADMYPTAVSVDPTTNALKLSGRWTAAVAKAASSPGSNSIRDAMSKFQNEALLGQATKVDAAATRHMGDITLIACIKPSNGDGFSLATSGMDGRVEIWTGAQMEKL